jgi:hypothetical protein
MQDAFQDQRAITVFCEFVNPNSWWEPAHTIREHINQLSIIDCVDK